MNIRLLVGTLVPLFFVLALGYFAVKCNSFDASQAAALSKLAMSYALPAAHLLSVKSPLSREAPVCCSLPVGPTIALFADRYKSTQSETASMLLISTLVPAIFWITK